jgi:hypothetical protein
VARDTTAIPDHPLECYRLLSEVTHTGRKYLGSPLGRNLQINQTTALAADSYPEMEGLYSWGSKHFGIKPTLTHASSPLLQSNLPVEAFVNRV